MRGTLSSFAHVLLSLVVVGATAAWSAEGREARQAAAQPSRALAQRAETIVDRLAARDFVPIVADFSAAMASALPEDKLRAAWDAVNTQAGAFVRRTTSRTETRGAFTAAIVSCDFIRAKVDVVVVFDQDGRIGGLQIRPAQSTAAYVLPAYAAAGTYTERDVTVGDEEWALPGTLSVPTGSGPFPAVVLVHGSGPSDRDASFGPNKVFKDLALGLASRGIVVLRYDKRTLVHAAKVRPLTQFTVKDETVDDALAAVARLRAEPVVDKTRIFVLGHSLGGMVAPRIAAADSSIAGIVVMAGAVRPLARSIVDQLQYLAEADGTISEAESRAIDDARKTEQTVEALTPADGAAGRGISGAPAS